MTAIAPATSIPAGSTWTVDTLHSSVGFAVKHMVVSTFRSQFEDYEATLTANEDGTLRLAGRVKADSIAIKDPQLRGHVLTEDFFAADEHPYVTFDSTLIRAEGSAVVVEGELTIKGTTLPIVARGTISEPAVTFGELEKVGVELEAVVDRTKYGLSWNAPLPKGGFALGNDVTLSVNLELARV
jgi:polyisoprenoid-binding protein YceI